MMAKAAAWMMAPAAGLMAVAAGAQAPAAREAAAPASCDADGVFRYICGQAGPEDMIQVPGTRWVVVGSFSRKGIKLVDSRTLAVSTIFPADNARVRFDARTYAGCPGPLAGDELAAFQSHGLALQKRPGGGFTLYAIHHGSRETVEVFALDVAGTVPRLTWTGCVVAPMPIGLNSVAPLPGGGFIVSNFRQRGPGETEARALIAAGKNNGELWEWHPGREMVKVPGSEASGANGIVLSRDGKWIYMAAWGGKSVEAIRRGAGPGVRRSVPVGFRIDNLRLGADGQIYGSGQQENLGTRVIRIDPVSLKVTEVLNVPKTATFGYSTVAIPVGRDVWVGSPYGDRIAVFTPQR